MRSLLCFALGACLALGTAANAAFLIEIDTDGLDDGILTYSPNFSFGGDTTTASQSAASPAVGMTGGDSIFGGDGNLLPDTYVYTYTPSVDGDNLSLSGGTALNASGDFASGLTAGGAGTYNLYATWPLSTNISGGPTQFQLSDSSGVVLTTTLDQNGKGSEWINLGSFALDPSEVYTLTQSPTVGNTFVSMRAAGVLFDKVPEPSTIALLGLAGLGVAVVRRRK